MRLGILISILAVALAGNTRGAVTLPMRTVFKGQDRFEQLVLRAKAENWKMLPIGQRTAVVGQAMVGTPYRSFTLEVDNRVESPSVNFIGLDCWTFFETALAFARMLDEPETNWTSAQLLHYIEIDRYRHAECTGEYLSRLHYLEDWLYDNDRRGLVADLTRSLGGVSVPHSAREMTNGWRHYRYLVHNRGLLRPLAEMEAEVSSRPLYEIPKRRVAAIEWRHYRHCLARRPPHLNPRYITRRFGITWRGRHRPLHACVSAAQLWPGRDRYTALELSLPLQRGHRDSSGAASALTDSPANHLTNYRVNISVLQVRHRIVNWQARFRQALRLICRRRSR